MLDAITSHHVQSSLWRGDGKYNYSRQDYRKVAPPFFTPTRPHSFAGFGPLWAFLLGDPMAWIECHDTIWNHHKTYRLAALLNEPKYTVVGRLIGLWHFVLQNAWKDSDLEAWGDDVIEEQGFWNGEKGVFARALRDAGFLDGFVVHGWQKRAGRLVQDRRRNERRKHRRTTGGKTADGRRKTASKLAATLPYPTIPNLTKDKDTTNTPAVAAKVASSPQADFVARFKRSYEIMTAQPFKAEKHHYVLAAKLLSEYGVEQCSQKVVMLGSLCKSKSAWFTKDGWGAFSIENLSKHWNSIIPEKAEPEEQKKQRQFQEELKKAKEQNERTDQTINR